MSETLFCSYGSIDQDFYFTHIMRTDPYEMSRRHVHAYYEIYYLFSGERYLFIQNTRYRLKKGDIAFIPKNVLHKTSTTPNSEHDRMAIHFTDNFMEENFNGKATNLLEIFQPSTPVHRVPAKSQKELLHLMHRIHQEILEQPRGYTVAIPHLVLELLLFACRNCGSGTAHTTDSNSLLNQTVMEVASFIHSHYHESLTLSGVAQRFYISPYYLSRVFKETTGVSFIEYLNYVRIHEAKQLLRETNWKVLDIAERVGFRNIVHFGRTFKRETQTTPQSFRKAKKDLGPRKRAMTRARFTPIATVRKPSHDDDPSPQ